MDLGDKTNLYKEKYIFGCFFLISNKLQVIGDRYLADEGITTRQWFLTAIISQFGDIPPTLGEVAEVMGTSRQNVKQLALKLEKKGFLKIEQDQQDARAIRLKLTKKSQDYWKTREKEDHHFIEELFKDLTEEEINGIYEGFNKLLKRIEGWDQ